MGATDPEPEPLRALLLVEDDDGDALLAQEMLGEGMPGVPVRRVGRLGEALPLLDEDLGCVVLDLGLPDGSGSEALAKVLDRAGATPVIVLTGRDDEAAGVAAVASGAQDYLVKGRLDADRLARAVRYAIERRRADENLRRLRESELAAAENARLERGLLPTPLVSDAVTIQVRYRPGRHRALLGGDFYDVVQRPDGSFTAVMGDVCGHGPDEAALGASLRIGWRGLVLAGHGPDEVLTVLERLLLAERGSEETFVTLCQVSVAPDGLTRVHRAGHPPPLCCAPSPRVLAADTVGPPLGLGLGAPLGPAEELRLVPGEALLLYTDGLIEGRARPGSAERLGVEGLLALLSEQPDPARPDLDALLAQVAGRDGGTHADDQAATLLLPRLSAAAPTGGSEALS